MKLLSWYYKYLSYLNSRKSTKGFTLTEILLAVSLSAFVLIGIGTALVVTLNADKKAEAKTIQRTQLNRALDYMTEDIKTARVISVDNNGTPSVSTDDKLKLNYFTDITPTANLDANSSKIVEYKLDTSSSPWLGPKVLQRREKVGAGAWGNWQVVVDGITENSLTALPNCTGADQSSLNNGGFQACITKAQASSEVDIYKVDLALSGELTDNNGTNSNSEVLDVTSRIFARSVDPSGFGLQAPVITAISETGGIVSLIWDPAEQGSQPYTYLIYRCDNTTGCNPIDDASSLVSNTTATTATDNVSSIADGYSICYKIKVIDQDDYSNISQTSCVVKTPPLQAPTISILTKTGTTVNLTWETATGGLAPYTYNLYRCDNISSCTPTTSIASGLSSTSTTDDVSLITSGNQICYLIKALDSEGSTADSESRCVGGPLVAPSTLTLDQSGNTFTLTWDTATGGTSPYSYQLYRCDTNSSTTCTPNTSRNTSSDTTPYNDDVSSISNGRKVCYHVYVTDSTSSNVTSSPTCTIKGNPLTAPEIQTGVETAGSVNLTWSAATGGTSPYNYKVYRCDDTTNCTPSSLITTTSSLSLNNNNVSSIAGGRRICYHVEVVDNSGSNLIGTPFCLTKDTSLAAPNITNNTTAIKPVFSWGAVSGATSYQIYRCEGTTCDPTSTGILLSPEISTTSYTESNNPTSGNKWCYAIKAKNSTTTSTFSNTVCGSQNGLSTPQFTSINFTANTNNDAGNKKDAVMNWNGIAGASYYKVYFCDANAPGTCTPNPSSNPNVLTSNNLSSSYTHLDPNQSKNNCYQVQAFSASQSSGLSNIVCLVAGGNH